MWSRVTICFASISNTWRRARGGIECRCKLGRDGGELRARPSRMQIAERSIAYRRYDIPGRNIIDTWILAQHYDISSRELESLGLKQLAQHFGLARKDRVYIDASKISHYFEHEPDKLYEYALDDARETRALAETLSPSYFVQAQIFPYSYQSAVLRGNATKIDALMMRAYLAAGHSIPAPSQPAPVAGGYTEMRRMRRRAQRPALRRDLAVSVADAAISACAGGRSSRRVSQAAGRPAQLPRAGQGARARTRGARTPQRRRAPADVQDSDQFILRLPGIFARAFQRLRPGERADQARTRPDSTRSRGTRRARRAGNRGRYRRNLFRAARRCRATTKARNGSWSRSARSCPRASRLEIDGRYAGDVLLQNEKLRAAG